MFPSKQQNRISVSWVYLMVDVVVVIECLNMYSCRNLLKHFMNIKDN